MGMRVETRDVVTGEQRTITLGRWRTHEFWAVNPARDGWCFQRAGREGLGTSYDPPLPGHSGFKTKREAVEFKRKHLR